MPNNYPPNFLWHYERWCSYDDYSEEWKSQMLDRWECAYPRLRHYHPVDAMILHIWLSKPEPGYRTNAEMAQLLGYSRGGMHSRLSRAWRRFMVQVHYAGRRIDS